MYDNNPHNRPDRLESRDALQQYTDDLRTAVRELQSSGRGALTITNVLSVLRRVDQVAQTREMQASLHRRKPVAPKFIKNLNQTYVWTTADGVIIPIAQLEDEHLMNCIRYMLTKAPLNTALRDYFDDYSSTHRAPNDWYVAQIKQTKLFRALKMEAVRRYHQKLSAGDV